MEKRKSSTGHGIKSKAVEELSEKIKKGGTFMIVDIKGLPSPQFQKIKKDLRLHAAIQVAKKNILKRAIEKTGEEPIIPLEEHILENCAFAISELEGFELAGILSKNKIPVFAKAGQTANEDIEIKAGPTSLVPGPAISELGALGIQISIENGKISIKTPKIIVKKEELIKEEVSSLLQKLEIKPFTIGLKPVAFYDNNSKKIYFNININLEEALKNLKEISGKSLGFAQKIGYFCKETIVCLLAKANSHGNALLKFNAQTKFGEEK